METNSQSDAHAYAVAVRARYLAYCRDSNILPAAFTSDPALVAAADKALRGLGY